MRLAEWPRDPYLNEEVREWVQLHLETLGATDVAVFAAVVGRDEDERRVVVATEVGLVDSWYAPRGSSARFGLSIRLYPWQAVHGVDLRGETSRVWAYEHESRWRLRIARPALDLIAETPELGKALAQFAAACAVMAEPAGAADDSQAGEEPFAREIAPREMAVADRHQLPEPPPRSEMPVRERAPEPLAEPQPSPEAPAAMPLPQEAVASTLAVEARDEAPQREAPEQEGPPAPFSAWQPAEPPQLVEAPEADVSAAADRSMPPVEAQLAEPPQATTDAQPTDADLPAEPMAAEQIDQANEPPSPEPEPEPQPEWQVSRDTDQPELMADQAEPIDEQAGSAAEPAEEVREPAHIENAALPAEPAAVQPPMQEPQPQQPPAPPLPARPRPQPREQEPVLSYEEQYPGEEVLFGINPLPAEHPPANPSQARPRVEGDGEARSSAFRMPVQAEAADANGEPRHGPFPRQVVRSDTPPASSPRPRPGRFPGQIFRVGESARPNGQSRSEVSAEQTPIKVEAESTAEVIHDLERRLGLRPRR